MSRRTEELAAYLAPDESIVEAIQGTLVDGGRRSAGTVGVTDRRLLFLSEGGRFVDVAHDSICSIRSHPRTTRTAAGFGYPLLAALGAVLAVSGIVAAVALQPGVLAFSLSVVAVVGPVAAEYVRRTGLDVDPEAVDVALRIGRGESDSPFRDLAGLDLLRRPPVEGGAPADNDALVLAVGLLSLVAVVALVAVVGSLLVLPLVLASLGGITLAAYAYRRTGRLEADGACRRHERDVSVRLVDGQVVDFRVDAGDGIDRTLSGVVRGPLRNPGPAGSAGSAVEPSGAGR